VKIYGDDGGSLGGKLFLFPNADDDTDAEYWMLGIVNDSGDLRLQKKNSSAQYATIFLIDDATALTKFNYDVRARADLEIGDDGAYFTNSNGDVVLTLGSGS